MTDNESRVIGELQGQMALVIRRMDAQGEKIDHISVVMAEQTTMLKSVIDGQHTPMTCPQREAIATLGRDVDDLKAYRWKAAGVIATLSALAGYLAKYLPNLFRSPGGGGTP